MIYARGAVTALLLLSLRTAPAPPPSGIFDGSAVVTLTIRAPLQQLFDDPKNDEPVAASVTFVEGAGQRVALGPAELSLRGNTSRKDCSFPKLKLKFHDDASAGPFAGLHGVRINTHCGEEEALDPTFGRLPNEKSPWREAVVYALLDTAGLRVPRVRLARITYVDTSPNGTIVPSPVTRNALLLEDDDDTVQRLGGTGTIAAREFTSARDHFTPDDTARVAFAEAMVGNFDWCLMFAAGDTYRCDARRKLWNVLAVRTASGAVPVLEDFDLAGTVTGAHPWFDDVFTRDYAASPIETEAVAQTQRTRTLFDRALLDRTRQAFLDRRAAVYDTLAGAVVDPHGRQLAKSYLDAFYHAIETDESFYRPVVRQDAVGVYADAAGTREACGSGDTVPQGTPVKVLGHDGDMAQVILLDALWRWAPPHECVPVHTRPVWIDAAAVGTDFPAASR